MKTNTKEVLNKVLDFLSKEKTTPKQLNKLKEDISNHLRSERGYFEITSVSRDDLNGAGFDTTEITDAQMERLADKMANDYCEQLFHSSMEIIANILEFPKKMTEDEFWEQYSPVQNHLVGDCSFDGCMFETYGEELQYVISKVDEQIVWTILDGTENDKMYIASGYHLVNRIGYLITEKPYTKDMEIELD